VENGNGGRYLILDPERNLTPTLMICRFALAVCSWLRLFPLGLQIALRSRTGRAFPSRLMIRVLGSARALPSRLGLRPRGSGFALAARAMRSRLGLLPRSLRYALAARALPLRLAPLSVGFVQ
jgi:hypothetical protein